MAVFAANISVVVAPARPVFVDVPLSPPKISAIMLFSDVVTERGAAVEICAPIKIDAKILKCMVFCFGNVSRGQRCGMFQW